MTRWEVYHGDIFSVEAQALICSANVFLTLSGGVGGELLRRYGPGVQQPLTDYLERQPRPHVSRGAVVEADGGGTAYAVILHAVAVDGMYESSVEVVADVIERALAAAARRGAETAVLPALATGYGRLTMDAFFRAVSLVAAHASGLERVTVALPDERDARALAWVLRSM